MVKSCSYSDPVYVLFLQRHHLRDISCLDASLLVSLEIQRMVISEIKANLFK